MTWRLIASVIGQVCVTLAINNRPEYVRRRNELIDEYAAALEARAGVRGRHPRAIADELLQLRYHIFAEICSAAERAGAIFEE